MNLLLLVMGLACFTKSERIIILCTFAEVASTKSQMHTYQQGQRWMRGLTLRSFWSPGL